MEKKPSKKAVTVSLDRDIIVAARELGINTSQAAQSGIDAEVRRVRALKWREENKGAIDAYNRYVEENGIPLQAEWARDL